MKRFLLDTCVISDGRHAAPNTGLAAWLKQTPPGALSLSVVTIAEILTGIERLPSGTRRQKLSVWFNALVVRFRGRILPADEDLVPAWARVRNGAFGTRNNAGELDLLIAATALHCDLTLVTRNEKDFAGTGIAVLNPWT